MIRTCWSRCARKTVWAAAAIAGDWDAARNVELVLLGGGAVHLVRALGPGGVPRHAGRRGDDLLGVRVPVTTGAARRHRRR
jgi:hypothetical protein